LLKRRTRDKRNAARSDLSVRDLDDFILASNAASNIDAALGDAEMACKKSDDGLIGLAFLWRLLDFDY
jgi:hypothetical protein